MKATAHMPTATMINGKAMAADLRKELAAEIAAMKKPPGLAVILIGDDPASQVYVKSKIKACAKAGINSFHTHLPEKARFEDVAAEIQSYNQSPDVHGILLQLPLPRHLDSGALIQLIDPAKDVDGLTDKNIGALTAGHEGLIPCTPQGALMLIQSVRHDLTGLHAVVIGRSLLFGKPMAQLLLAENCTVTQAHSRTKDLEHVCHLADILVVATGRPKMIRKNWIKPGAIVIDVGINRLEDGTLCGDVDFEYAIKSAGAITPVPGGVGPMTIACLLKNTVKAAKAQGA